MKEPRYSGWARILELCGLAWWKVKPIDWSRLKRKQKKHPGEPGLKVSMETGVDFPSEYKEPGGYQSEYASLIVVRLRRFYCLSMWKD